MGVLRTYAFGLALVVSTAGAGAALPSTASDQARAFAYCLGRLSAQMEHEWSFDSAGAERTAASRRAFEALLEAVIDQAEAQGLRRARVMDWRLGAKAAHAALLSQATFGRDPRQVRYAAGTARMYRAECEHMLLSGR